MGKDKIFKKFDTPADPSTQGKIPAGRKNTSLERLKFYFLTNLIFFYAKSEKRVPEVCPPSCRKNKNGER